MMDSHGHAHHNIYNHNPLKAARITVALVIVLIAAKLAAYVVSGSASVLSSLMDSLADAGLSVMTMLAVTWSLKPADDRHRHGHGKIEAVSALLQSAFLLSAGSFLLLEALNRFITPVALTEHIIALFLMAFSTVISFIISRVQKHGADHSGSLALEADHAHYATDVWLNASVFAVLLLGYLNIGPLWLDPLCAVFVAGLFMYSSYGIAVKAFDMLMDREEDGPVREKITKIIAAHADQKGFHDLRITKSGMRYFISFDLELDGDLSLTQAHDIARVIEYQIHAAVPQAEVLIHLDPHGDPQDLRHGHHAS